MFESRWVRQLTPQVRFKPNSTHEGAWHSSPRGESTFRWSTWQKSSTTQGSGTWLIDSTRSHGSSRAVCTTTRFCPLTTSRSLWCIARPSSSTPSLMAIRCIARLPFPESERHPFIGTTSSETRRGLSAGRQIRLPCALTCERSSQSCRFQIG